MHVLKFELVPWSTDEAKLARNHGLDNIDICPQTELYF